MDRFFGIRSVLGAFPERLKNVFGMFFGVRGFFEALPVRFWRFSECFSGAFSARFGALSCGWSAVGAVLMERVGGGGVGCGRREVKIVGDAAMIQLGCYYIKVRTIIGL